MTRKTDDLASALLRRLRTAKLDVGLVSDFTKAKPGTIASWLAKGQPPRGEKLNRLQHLLALLDIESPELDSVTPFGLYVGRLMAFGLIDLAKAQLICGVGHTQAVFETIRGERDPFDPDMANQPTQTLQSLREEYGNLLSLAQNTVREQFGTIVPAAPTEAAKARAFPDVERTLDDPRGSRTEFLAEIASRLGAVTPLVRFLLEECDAEERALIRSLLGGEGVFDLSNLLTELCSERARTHQGR